MKVLLFNGSPRRNGNTAVAAAALAEAIRTEKPDCELQIINVTDFKLSPCVNCDACRSNGGNCVTPDDSAKLMQLMAEADAAVFATPVYWWGVTAQLKMLIDKFYSKEEEFRKKTKRIGVFSVGGAELSDPEYRIIAEQFNCICEFLNWKMVFSVSAQAGAAGELSGNHEKIAELKKAAAKLFA